MAVVYWVVGNCMSVITTWAAEKVWKRKAIQGHGNGGLSC